MNSLLASADAVIFDVDGLLIDSEPLWQLTRDEFFKKRGMRYDMSIDHLVVGRGIRDIMEFWKKHFGIKGDVQELTDEYRSLFYHLALDSKKLTLMAGAEELIHELFSRNKRLAIATGGHPREKMLGILKLFKLEKYFSVVVSSDQVKKGKPAPDIFLFTAKELQIPKESCVILEDAPNGVEAAKAAQMKVIAVQKDPFYIHLVESLHPDTMVRSLADLL